VPSPPRRAVPRLWCCAATRNAHSWKDVTMKKWIFTQAARKAFASILLLRVALLRRRSSAGARPFQPRGWGFPAAFGVRRARRGPALRHGGGTARRGSRSHPALPCGPLCSTPVQLLERAKPGQNPRDTRV